MGSITIRNVDDEIKRGARLVAAGNGRSLEAELRDLLKRTYAPKTQDRGEWLRSLSGKDAIAHLIKVANGAGEGVFDEDHEELASEPAIQRVRDVTQIFRHEPGDLAQQSKATRDAEHAARIRAMSSKEFIDHLIATAAGAGLELPKRTVSSNREIFGAD